MSDKHQYIQIHGATQNNLKNVTIDIPLNQLVVVTGVSGSGKSSLAFDTVYSEGQRRYVETFSPYARQFLDRMDKPRAERIDGIPPAIAIDQTNPVRTSRSTVGTMTELNDHLKLLFARAAILCCRSCGKPVQRDTSEHIFTQLIASGARCSGSQATIAFPAPVPANFTQDEVRGLLAAQGYSRIIAQEGNTLVVAQDRVVLSADNRQRIIDDLETALKHGHGRVSIYTEETSGDPSSPLRFSSDLHCAACDIHYHDPLPSLFSFNSPIGACETCRGFGRTVGIDYRLVIPDETLTLALGAIKPWQTPSYSECQDELMKFARKRAIPTNVPWNNLTEAQREWVTDGEGSWEDGKWYGIKRFFEWLETKSYRMHIRVLLSRYRSYRTCPSCDGSRLKPDALLWRLGEDRLTLHDIMVLPIDRCLDFFGSLRLPAPMDEAAEVLLSEIRTRLSYLVEVGLGYLTLDRQSRTLSGGEVQRINLTTALGTSLVNTLFVLDEPSIGLHPRDIQRLIAILKRLRDAGNTLLVVEHDPDVIRAADRLIDMGPGPGEHGGEVVYFGPLAGLKKCKNSLTAQYLAGVKTVQAARGTHSTLVTRDTPCLRIYGAREHNLKSIDVSIPLQRLVCITGVSGSGKSTLARDVCYNALRALKHRPVDEPGEHREITGHEHIDEIVMVDQSPIGKTTRSNPASYVGALDEIRKLFAAEPLARERNYTAGTFSFNSGNGRCPTCSGNGFQHIEMQFLSDVYLRCPDCDGRRYRSEVLEVKLKGIASMAGILDMTVSEAAAFFPDNPAVLRGLKPLIEVGLGYVKLGQPVPTLSGGEAQRLKLAGYLAESAGVRTNGAVSTDRVIPRKHILFLFDEPTTGLHFDDIAVLLQALYKLLDQGHSVVVIEHNVDVIRSADWIIDLGPEGGDAGGEIVCVGTPAQVAQCEKSHTGAALRLHAALGAQESDIRPERNSPARSNSNKKPGPSDPHPMMRVHNARQHNLKGVDVGIPRDKFTVVTGISGSGKSTLAFDILFAEGQRRYLESLNAYARQFVQPAGRPDVDALYGIPPTVAIEQRVSRGGRKSTVATVTEVYHFMRLLFVKLGIQHCPDCVVPIHAQTAEAVVAQIMKKHRGARIGILAPLVSSRKGYYTDLAAWAARNGFSHLRVDGALIPTDPWPRLDRFKEHTIELPVGEVDVCPEQEPELRKLLEQAAGAAKGVMHIVKISTRGRGSDRSWKGAVEVFSATRACPRCGRGFEELDPRMFSFNSKHGWCERCFGTGLHMSGFDENQTGEEIWWNAWWDGSERVCPQCNGRRLRPEALAVRFHDRSITELTGLTVDEAVKFFDSLRIPAHETEIARDIVSELLSRLSFLRQVGLQYLSLDRAAPTLSGGEAQRIRLAAQLGSNLRGVCYILDEPTIGLHSRDNRMLLDTLRSLNRKGNTVVVVEHDEDTIRHADHIVDLGPGAGTNGGRLVAEGNVAAIMKCAESVTGMSLRHPLKHPLVVTRRLKLVRGKLAPEQPILEISGATLHNLKDLQVSIPLGSLTCVTGVSGSGKSTLVRDILHDSMCVILESNNKRGSSTRTIALRGCRAIKGAERVRRVLEVDQTPIGRTPRSCPATYIGFWDDIRRLFALSPEARMRGYTVSRFSFNTSGGRCEACEGQGMKKIEMSFLPDVTVLCEVCGGKRFTAETLEATFRDKTIAEVLSMNVDQAAEFFTSHPKIHRALKLLQDVGLGYLTLGQQSPTLSGGEAQRIKLVTELAKAAGGRSWGPSRKSYAVCS
jgi:excinuclease ABC subunit A